MAFVVAEQKRCVNVDFPLLLLVSDSIKSPGTAEPLSFPKKALKRLFIAAI